MNGSSSSSGRVSVEERPGREASPNMPVPSIPLPVPVQKMTRVRSMPSAPSPLLPTPSSENLAFVRSGVLPSRDSDLQLRERRLFLWIFIGMLMLFAALLTVILVSRI